MAEFIEQPHGGKLKPLGKGQTANPNGRPPMLFGSVNAKLKEEGYQPVSRSQMVEGLSILLGCDEDKLRKISENIELPKSLRIMASEVLGKRGAEAVEMIQTRAHGSPNQKIEIEGELKGDVWIDKLLPEQRMQILQWRLDAEQREKESK